ncbi:MAG: hypothetical protein P4L33_05970, partial [Capsulimonadaceae bacterium]|nr:hypothetical protein [Capsulimonadaceae bacterium]
VIANGSWDKAVPCAVHLKSFAAGKAEGVVLSQDDENAPPLLESKDDAIHDFPVSVSGSDLKCDIPPHSVVFVTLKRR